MKPLSESIISVASAMALNNDQWFCIAAILMRHKTVVRIGVNQARKTTKSRVKYTSPGVQTRCYLHAEVDALSAKTKPTDVLYVFRIKRRTKEFTMAKPCSDCAYKIGLAGIKKVYYTDWDGTWRRL